MATVQKGLIQRQDQDNYDGTLATSRVNSSGGTTSGLKVGDGVDVLSVFGSGDTGNMNRATINTAISTLGSQNVALIFAPGTWTIDDNLTIASNFTCVFPAGCVFNTAAGKTTTIQGVFFRQHATYSSGSGTFTISGTDLLAGANNGSDYAADDGDADVYTIAPTPAISSYTAGQMFAFKAENTNTGSSTLNVNSKGAKTIKRLNGNNLSAGDITAGSIYHVRYDGTNFQLIGSWFISLADDTSPQLGGVLDTNSKQVRWSKGADVASANALTLGNDGNYFDITGTTAITSIGTKAVGTVVKLHFDGILTLTHHSADLILPGSANITTAAGDEAEFVEYATGDWRCTNYTKATGKAVIETASSVFTLDTAQATTSGTSKTFTAPSTGVKGAIVHVVGVSTGGTSAYLIQLGDSGGTETTGYTAVAGGRSAETTSTAGFIIVDAAAAAATYHGHVDLYLESSANNTWTSTGVIHESSSAPSFSAGTKSLSAELTTIVFTTVSGDTLDAGEVNVTWIY